MGTSTNSTASDIVYSNVPLAINYKATRKVDVDRAKLKIE